MPVPGTISGSEALGDCKVVPVGSHEPADGAPTLTNGQNSKSLEGTLQPLSTFSGLSNKSITEPQVENQVRNNLDSPSQ